jgi:hypothetical protein
MVDYKIQQRHITGAPLRPVTLSSSTSFSELQEVISNSMGKCSVDELHYGYVISSWTAKKQKDDMVVVTGPDAYLRMITDYRHEVLKQKAKKDKEAKKDPKKGAESEHTRVEVKILDLRKVRTFFLII